MTTPPAPGGSKQVRAAIQKSLPILLLLISCSPSPARPHPQAVAQPTVPQFVPDKYSCVSTSLIPAGSNWQVSAPRGNAEVIYPEGTVRLGLRKKFGSVGETHQAVAQVLAPHGSATKSTALPVTRDDWTYVLYPEQFPGADPVYPGVYTVVWTADGDYAVCDGFVVQSYINR